MQTFKKEERLCSKKLIDELFDKGKSFSINPIKIIWLKAELNSVFPAQVLIVVPKRNIKSAVDRNRIKRQIREAYRKNKDILYKSLLNAEKQCAFAIIYLEKNETKFKELEDKIILSIERLTKVVSI